MKGILVSVALLVFPLLARGETADSVRNYLVNEVVVTATRTPLPLKDTPVITRVISGKEIEMQAIPGIEELLQRELAGVEFHQAGYGTTMSFQGLDARYVLFLVDGERMSGETYGNIDYNRIPVSSIDRIEIIRGASSVLYGSNAMGAVVNIITKMPEKKFEVAGSVRYGTRFQKNTDETLGSWATQKDIDKYHNKLDLPNMNADLSVGFNTGKLRSLTTGTFQTADGYKLRGRKSEQRYYAQIIPMKMEGMTFPPSFTAQAPVFDTTIYVSADQRGLAVSGLRSWNISEKLDYRVSDMFRFELSANYFVKNRYDFLTSVMDDNPMSGIIRTDTTWGYESYEGYNARFLMEHSPNDKNKIYLSFLRDQYSRNQEALHQGSVPKQRHTYNIPRLLWTYDAGRWTRLTTGVEYINERLRFDLNKDGDKGFDDVKSLRSAAVYMQDEILKGEKLSFVAGVRGDWTNKFGFRVTPKLSAKYDFGDFSLRANYSNGYRTPSLKEMYMLLNIPIAGSPIIEGNPELKPEKNHYISLSLDYNLSWLNLSATAGKSYFRDKIDARWVGVVDGKTAMRYENLDKSQLTTVELIGRVKLARSLFLNANYIYMDQNEDSPAGTTQYIFPSPHTVTAAVDYSFMARRIRYGFNFNVRYIGKKKYEDFMPYVNFQGVLKDFLEGMADGSITMPPNMADPDIREMMMQVAAAMNNPDYYYTGNYTSRHKGYAICNASVNVQFPQWFALTVGVNNIFDYRPAVVNFNSALTPGVNGFVKVAFSF